MRAARKRGPAARSSAVVAAHSISQFSLHRVQSRAPPYDPRATSHRTGPRFKFRPAQRGIGPAGLSDLPHAPRKVPIVRDRSVCRVVVFLRHIVADRDPDGSGLAVDLVQKVHRVSRSWTPPQTAPWPDVTKTDRGKDGPPRLLYRSLGPGWSCARTDKADVSVWRLVARRPPANIASTSTLPGSGTE